MTMKRTFFAALIIALMATAAYAQRGISVNDAPANSKRRVALVIGNGDYATSPLRNPANDARAMAGALRGLGFEVILGTDMDQGQMKRAIIRFGRQLEKGGVGLFYYAGHGVQVDGRNYLVPVGSRIKYEEEVEVEAVDANYVLARMAAARNHLNIVILDACRDNPFARSFRTSGKGLAQMTAPRGTFIAYATGPGSVAADGSGSHSYYTQALLKQMRQPGRSLEKVFKRVRAEVLTATNGVQVPWESSSVVGDFYFSPGGDGIVPTPEPARPVQTLPPRPTSTPRPSQHTADLYVTTEPGEAMVYLDGRQKGRAPLTLERVPVGSYKLEARKGYLIARQDVALAPDDLKKVHLKLEHQKGDLKLFSTPAGAEVTLDGKSTGKRTPCVLSGLKAASHKLSLSKSEGNAYYAYQGEVLVKPGGNRVSLTLKKDKTPRRITNSIGMEFVFIPAGSFTMGSPSNEQGRDSDEGPQHRVTISKPFYMQTTEVTQGQWRRVMGGNPSHFKSCGSNCPVESVSWDDAQEFISKLNAMEGGNKYRLPTEAQWEYACRAGTTATFNMGNNITTNQANYNGKCPMPGYSKGQCHNKTLPVKSFSPNKWGLYDMHGNVREWCSDRYGKDYYSSSPTRDPQGASSSTLRVLRGGSWLDDAGCLRSADRFAVGWDRPDGRRVGFRITRITP